MAYKILIYGFTSNPGGVESFLINYLKRFDLKKINVDFIDSEDKPLSHKKEISDLGSKIIPLVLPSRIKHPFKRKEKINSFFKKYSQYYDCIWFNILDADLSDLVKSASKFGIHKVIVHSHNSNVQAKGFKRKRYILKNNIYKYQIAKYATDYWACSKIAAEWLFPKSILSKVKIINNAINVKKYKFNSHNAIKIRRLNKITNNFIIGNVGRLTYQKNQIFILKILKQLIPKIPNVKLVLIGTGPDKDMLKEKAKEFGITNYIIWAGVQDNVNEWYSAFDLFLFPSLFEGLSIASLEAQANGLPILANKNVIPPNSIINDNIKLLNLEDSAEQWAAKILSMKKIPRENYDRINTRFKLAGFNIDYEAPKLEKLIQK